jgi:signal peptidase II
VVVLGLAADIATKYWAFRSLADYPVVFGRADVLATRPISRLIPFHEPTVVVPYLLEFKLVLNPGAVFGIGAGKQWFFTAFAVVAVFLCLWMFTRGIRRSDRWSQAALGLVIAGALGNLYDRVVYACVRDFIHPLPNVTYPFGIVTPWSGDEVWPWVSNVADKLLLVGVAVLVVRLWTHPLHSVRAAKASTPAAG